MIRGVFSIILVVVGILCLGACGDGGGSDTLRLQIQLPSDWKDNLDMAALGFPDSAPYVGTIRVIIGEGDGASIREFPWEDHQGALGEVDTGGSVRVQAVTAGKVVMEGVLPESITGPEVAVPLHESGGFSKAGSLLYVRKDHSAVAVGDTVLIIGGNVQTTVIEELVPLGTGLAVNAYAASLANPRSGQHVLHDTLNNRLFVFKGGLPGVDDNFYEVIDLEKKEISSKSLLSFRVGFFPVIYEQKIVLVGGYNDSARKQWLIGGYKIDISCNPFEETLLPFIGLNSERESTVCEVNQNILICAGGYFNFSYFDEVNTFNILTEIGLGSTQFSEGKIGFQSLIKTTDSQIFIGGINNTGVLEKIDTLNLQNISLNEPNFISVGRSNHSGTQVSDGLILILGGGLTAEECRSGEILDLATGESTRLFWKMRVPRIGHSATPLPDGRVLVVGGNLNDRTIEIWNPPSGF
ncbi:MAG: hypothetical protein JXR72_05150 [Proteobacteria bacterium]|nr:hypothetical protein [Pseudomonadota bacterium]